MPMEDHKKRYPDSERTFTPEGSDSDSRPLVTPEQSPTRPKKTPKQHGIPEVARHTPNRGQDQEVSDAESEASGDEEAAMKQGTGSRHRDIRGRSRKRSKWLMVDGPKRRNKPQKGDQDRGNGSSQGPDSRKTRDAQAQETNEATIDSTDLDLEDTRECWFLMFLDDPTS